MKKIRNRSLIVWLLAMAFIGGMIYFSINLIIHADLWASKPQNAHIGVDGMGMAGTITDINGEILAYSENGNRYYNSNEDIRCALRAEISVALYKMFIARNFQDIVLFLVWGFLMA
jgi:peptidoglycan glycosyltransferase